MRTIDADALKKCAIPCQIHNGALTDLCVPLYLIDNAPTVEYTFEEAFQKSVCEQKLYCPSRPQGEWARKVDEAGFISHICSECGAEIEVEDCSDDKFCFNCGAKMKGGAE